MPKLVGPLVTQTGITPAATDNSTQLATTAYVAANGFAADNMAVHVASPELITGVKTFAVNPTIPTGAKPGYVLTATDITGQMTWSTPQVARSICCGRLTATSGDPIGTRDTPISIPLIYYTPFQGNLVGLYNGSSWDLLTFPEIMIPIPSNVCPYGQAWDIFAYNNSGVVAIEMQPWAPNSIVTRNILLGIQDGVYINSNDATRRYIGSIYCWNNLTYDTPQIRGIWNYYNRIQKRVYMTDPTTATWTQNNSNNRPINNNTANYIQVMVGVKESLIELQGGVSNYSPTPCFYGIQLYYDYTGFTSISGNNVLQGSTGVHTGDNAFDCNHGHSNVHVAQTVSTFHLTDVGLHTYWLTEYGGSADIQIYALNRLNGTYPGMVGLFMC